MSQEDSRDENRFAIQLRPQTGSVIDAEVLLHEEEESESECTLTLTFAGGSYTATADDYFDAFCAVRRDLEKRQLLPLCYGASRNVYPSGMCRDMGRGLTGYKMVLGEKARQRDLVRIFATGPDVEPVTVDEQRQFTERWRESLAAKPGATAESKPKAWWRFW